MEGRERGRGARQSGKGKRGEEDWAMLVFRSTLHTRTRRSVVSARTHSARVDFAGKLVQVVCVSSLVQPARSSYCPLSLGAYSSHHCVIVVCHHSCGISCVPMEQLTEFVSKSFACTDRLSVTACPASLQQDASNVPAASLFHHQHVFSSPTVVSPAFAFPSTAFNTAAMVGFGHLSFLSHLAPSSSPSTTHLVRNLIASSPTAHRSCSQASSPPLSDVDDDDTAHEEMKKMAKEAQVNDTCPRRARKTPATPDSLEDTHVPSNTSSISLSSDLSNKSNRPNSSNSNSNSGTFHANLNPSNVTCTSTAAAAAASLSVSDHKSSNDTSREERKVVTKECAKSHESPSQALSLLPRAGESIEVSAKRERGGEHKEAH